MLSTDDLIRMRKEYSGRELNISNSPENPFDLFTEWFHEATETKLPEPNAMILATANRNGTPSVRTVLLKIFDQRGFAFFTNYQSHKGRDISENPYAEILFLWMELERQVRIYGKIERTTADESDSYFSARPYAARLSAIASPQSQPLNSYSTIKEKIDNLMSENPNNKGVCRPDYWGGFRLIPEKFEFWQGRTDRLHHRLEYKEENATWNKRYLAP
jgi:pyridoxamine 5'-phosphate oxidase